MSNIQPAVHLSVLRDVTARNRMLRALTRAEVEFRELAENAADIVAKLRFDGDGGVMVDYVNPAATTILGYARQRLYDDPALLLELFHRRGGDLDDRMGLLPTRAEPTRLATVELQRADGRLVWLESCTTLTDPSSTPVTIQVVVRDVTARLEMALALEQALDDQLQAAEQLRELNAMKDTFLQSVSHELRTPLSTILGFAELLADPDRRLSPGDTQEFHRRILNNARRLQRLLDDLLDVDRFARGSIEPHRHPTDLTALVERMATDIELGDHPIELDLAPITVDLDAPLIERLVANLLRNIVLHTPADTRIWIRTRATTGGCELTVDDDGPGIPAADRQRVIEPFQQGPRTTFSAEPGTGVGLSLVQIFAQLHGGDLVISDGPAGGARMTVTLARTTADRTPATGGARGPEAATPPVQAGRHAGASAHQRAVPGLRLSPAALLDHLQQSDVRATTAGPSRAWSWTCSSPLSGWSASGGTRGSGRSPRNTLRRPSSTSWSVCSRPTRHHLRDAGSHWPAPKGSGTSPPPAWRL